MAYARPLRPPAPRNRFTRFVAGFIGRSIARRVAISTAAVAALATTVVGFVIVFVVMRDEAPAARGKLAAVAFAGGAATVVCVALATAVIVNRVLGGALESLRRSLDSAERGRWLKTIGSDRPDEIGDVARAFDRLAATVTDLAVSVIDADRELATARRELQLKEALTLLFELTQIINAEGREEGILAALPERVCAALGFEQMAVLLHDEAAARFVVRSAYGMPAGTVGLSFSSADPICGRVLATGAPLLISDTARDTRYTHFDATHPVDGALACVPMRVHGRIVGVFQVLRPGGSSIGEGDVRLLTALASYAGLAIAQARGRTAPTSACSAPT